MAIAAALTLVGAFPGAARAQPTVESVEAVWGDGSQDPIPPEVLRLIAVRPGDRYRPLAVRQSVKQIFALGRFRNVRVRSEPGEAGAVRLRFHLDHLPRVVAADFSGVPTPLRSGLAEVAAISAGVVPPDLVPIEERVEAWLADQGYLEAAVDVRAVPEGRDVRLAVEVTAGSRARIESFETEGVPPELVREMERILGTAPGRLWDETEVFARLPEAERRLRREGFLAAEGALDFAPLDSGGVRVVLTAVTGPRISLAVEESALSQAAIRRLLEPIEEGGATADAVEAVRAELLARLVEDGHHEASVIVVRTEDPAENAGADRLEIRFTAVPGPRYVIGALELEGLAPDLSSDLTDRAAQATAPFREGRPFREAEWTATAEGLRRVFRRAGHPFAEAGSAWEMDAGREEPEDVRTVSLALIVDAGPRIRIGAVGFEGGTPFSDDELLAAAGIAVGDPWSTEAVIAAREDLESWLADRGFLDAAVTADAPLVAGTPEAAVRFSIRSGDYSTVGEIIVAGLDVTRESVVRNQLPFAPGEPLGRAGLLESRRRLAAMGTFSSVEVDLLEPEEAVSDRNLLIRVVEGPRTSLGYGAGYSEREQVRGEVEWSRRNLFGRNHSGSLFARVSLKGNRLVATYQGAPNPDGRNPVFVSAFREAQDRESLDFIRSGVALQVTREVFGREVFLRYDFTSSELFDLKIAPNEIDRNYADNLWLSTVSASIVTDTRDDPVNPRRGRFAIWDLEWSSALLGSRAPYLKTLVQQYAYFPVTGSVVLAAALRAGAAVTIGPDEPVLLPITQRFFAGGATTHRGFQLDKAGPLDDSDYPLGGNLLLLGNLEIRFPLVGSLRGAVFSDHGGVHSEVGSIRVGDLHQAVGAGLRYDTPLGPVRFDYGIRLGDVGADRRGQWHFTIGHAF